MFIFAGAFLFGALSIFALTHLLGRAVRLDHVPLWWRVIFAAGSLVGLALLDLVAIRQRRYCPLTLRRQTPNLFRSRYRVSTVLGVWGFDTGLAVTTFRVAAVTWGALVMTGLGLASWTTGLAYWFGFVVPLVIMILCQGSLMPSNKQASFGGSMEWLLGKRVLMQLGSSVVLFAAAATLLVRVIR